MNTLLSPRLWLLLFTTCFLWGILCQTHAAAPYRTYVGVPGGGFYAAGDYGELSYFKHQPETSAAGWTQDTLSSPDWNETTAEHLIYSGNGVLYAANLKGELNYYKDTVVGNVHSISSPVKVSLGNGWAAYRWLLGDGGGRIYAVDEAGGLFFYQHSELPNSTWPSGNAKLLGNGWQGYKKLIAGRDGIIYALDYTGSLYYYRDLARDGTVNWQFGSVGLFLGNGWNRFQHIVSTGNGNLYGIDELGDVYYYHVTVTGTGAVDWSGSNAATPINPGARVAPHLYKGVYAWPLSAAPGEPIDFKISLGGQTQVTISRLNGVPSQSSPQRIFKQEHVMTTSIQPVFDVPARRGCGWETSYQLVIPDAWESGTYLCQCYPVGSSDDPVDRQAYEATFVVKPKPTQRSQIACLANTNTWNAYNPLWGGSHYTINRSNLSFLRPLTDNVTEVSGTSLGLFHLGSGELWVQYWFEHECLSPSSPPFILGKGIRPDVYTDLDFHNGIDLSGYRALFISTHPEYWSDAMYQHLAAYIQSGGVVLYLGGNGIYERVSYSADHTQMILNGGVDLPPGQEGIIHDPDYLFRTATGPTMNERDLLGIATAHCGIAGGGYRMLIAGHPFLRGVVADGSGMIGAGNQGLFQTVPRAEGMNGKAAGYETDNADGADKIIGGECSTGPALATTGIPLNPLQARRAVIAKAFSADGGGDAEMCYYPHPSGGFVFSVGSITFGGMLVVDPQLQQLLRNVVKEALTPAPSILSFISPATGQYNLRFHGRPGALYGIEGSVHMGTDWTEIVNVPLTDAQDEYTSIAINGNPRYFYRVKRKPF